MNVVYASDDNFAEIMGVSICSLLENNKAVSELIIYVLDDAIGSENKMRLQIIADRYRRKIVFTSIQLVKNKILKIKQDRGGASQFSRLFFSKLISNKCNRIFYLDCDTIIRSDLEKFYNQDLENNIVCGVLDCISKQHRARLGLKENAVYINSGVMLIDFNAWLKQDIERKIETIITQFEGRVPYADQGIVNLALQGHIKCVHPRYNCMSIFTYFTFSDLLEYRLPSACSASADIEEAKANPVIVHFVTLFCTSRPWFKDSEGPFFDEWRSYRLLSPWKNNPERLKHLTKKQFLLSVFYKYVPHWLSLPIVGFLHAIIKPLVVR